MMNKKEFENSKKPFSLIVSVNTETGKLLYAFYEGWDNQGMLETFRKDFPDMIHFGRLNKSAVKIRNKEMFNIDLEEDLKNE